MINTYVDDVMKLLLKELDTVCLPYNPEHDPTRQILKTNEHWQDEFTKREWTIGPRSVSTTRKRLSNTEGQSETKKPPPKKQKNGKKISPNSAVDSICDGEVSQIDKDEVDSIKVETTELNGLHQENKNERLSNIDAPLKQEPHEFVEPIRESVDSKLNS